MRIIEVSLQDENGFNLKKWYGIDKIPDINIDFSHEKVNREIMNFWLCFKRLDFGNNMGTRGFSVQFHRFLFQSDYSVQELIADLMR